MSIAFDTQNGYQKTLQDFCAVRFSLYLGFSEKDKAVRGQIPLTKLYKLVLHNQLTQLRGHERQTRAK